MSTSVSVTESPLTMSVSSWARINGVGLCKRREAASPCCTQRDLLQFLQGASIRVHQSISCGYEGWAVREGIQGQLQGSLGPKCGLQSSRLDIGCKSKTRLEISSRVIKRLQKHRERKKWNTSVVLAAMIAIQWVYTGSNKNGLWTKSSVFKLRTTPKQIARNSAIKKSTQSNIAGSEWFCCSDIFIKLLSTEVCRASPRCYSKNILCLSNTSKRRIWLFYAPLTANFDYSHYYQTL